MNEIKYRILCKILMQKLWGQPLVIWKRGCYRLLLSLYSGFSMCPYQLLRSYERHEENKSKIGQERSSMQQADYQCHRPTPWMQESVPMHIRPTPVRHSRMNRSRSVAQLRLTKQEEGNNLGNEYLTYPSHRMRLSSHRIWPPCPRVTIDTCY